MTKQELSFEEAMKDLEEVVEKLEEAEVPLEKAIQYYQKGIELSKLCNEKLTNVEKQMTQIVDADGVVEPLIIEEEQ